MKKSKNDILNKTDDVSLEPTTPDCDTEYEDSVLAERRERITGFMKEASYKPLKLDELIMVLDVPKSDHNAFKKLLEAMESDGEVYKSGKDRYGIPERMNLVVGSLIGNERGFGFLRPDDPDMKDIFIPADYLGGAYNGDRVMVKVLKKTNGDKRAEGEVIRVVKRSRTTLVGTYGERRFSGYVIPDDRKISGEFIIPKEGINDAQPGQKVVIEITRWPGNGRNAEGRITEIIGNSGDPGTDILSIIHSYNLSTEFPEAVINEAESMSENVGGRLPKGRRNLKDLKMVTIDGEDAKDLDDAVSIERLPDGMFRLGVHIADVSYYVTEGSELDREAYRRGTSVYLVDRVIPMLPKKLSNGICSLNPKVDRMAFSVFMNIDGTGRVCDHEIFESVININERMTYTNVYKILVENDSELCGRYSELMPEFRMMEELAGILRSKRTQRGAIDFDFDEAKVILDETGKPIDVKRYEMTIANSIIEEFMLACNETVAEHFFWAETPFVYRVHEDPDPDKIQVFAEFASNLGYPVKGINKIHPRALQEVLEKAKGTKEEAIVSSVMLRSLAKARYCEDNLGHFGLAAKYYCHFTSPIRRYPDLIIHRIMKEYLKGKVSSKRDEFLRSSMPGIALQCSQRERAADEAERDTEDLKKVEYMKSREGEVFEGVISNVTSFGMFIELENTIEGLVKMSSMDDDYYVFDDKHFCLIGERRKKVYKIGEKVKIRVARADIAARQLDFILEESFGRSSLGRNEQGSSDAGRNSSARNTSGGSNSGRNADGRGSSGSGYPGKSNPGKSYQGKSNTGRGSSGSGYPGKKNSSGNSFGRKSTAKTNSGMNAEAKDGAVKVDGMASITGEASAESDNRGKTFKNRYERRKASHRDNVRGKNTGGGTGRTGAGGSGRTGAGGSGKSGKNGGSAGGKFNKGKR